MIRNLIKRHRPALKELGVCYAVEQTSGPAGGRPATAYYLNKRQAVFITAKSETARATEITIEVIQRFDEYENGERTATSPVLDMRNGKQLAAAALQLIQINQEITAERDCALQQVEASKPKVAAYDRFLGADGSFLLSVVAAQLGLQQKFFFDALKCDVLIYKDGDLLPRAEFRGRGFFVVKAEKYGDRLRHVTRVIPKGLEWLAHRLGVAQADFFVQPRQQIAGTVQ